MATHRIMRSKLLAPSLAGTITRERLFSRERLLTGQPDRIVAAQAPAGAGKSLFLAQYMAHCGLPSVYYRLDEADRDPAVPAAHLRAGFAALWPDWQPDASLAGDPAELAVELVNEAAGRPPFLLALDGLDAAFGEPWLADLLALLLRYMPPAMHLALATRAPLPVSLTGASVRILTATDLAMTPAEAAEWLGEGGPQAGSQVGSQVGSQGGRAWQDCLEATGGYPLALQCWQQGGGLWPQLLAERLLASMPAHLSREVSRSLIDEWLGGRLSLADFAHQTAQGRPSTEQLRQEMQEARHLLLLGRIPDAHHQLTALWDSVRGQGEQHLAGAVALLLGEAHYCLGEYGEAMEWYRQAFEADPLLETTGTHSMIAILKDQGQLAAAEELARRCISGNQTRSDLQALAYAHTQYATVLAELERFDEAEQHYLEAERFGLKLSGEPFYGILAMAQRSVLYALMGNPAGQRRLADEAHTLARRRSPWLAAISGYILAPALLAWGEREAGLQHLRDALAYLTAIDAKWQLHMVRTILAVGAWSQNRPDDARSHFGTALSLAAQEGYVQYLAGARARALPLILDALVRSQEAPFCQELLARMGERALPALLDLAKQDDPAARRAAVYPLTTIGGQAAVDAIRHLLYDPEEAVRDAALLALQSLGAPPRAGEAPPGAAEVQPRAAGAPPEAADAAAAGPGTPTGRGAPIRIQLLGPMQVTVAGEPVRSWRTLKARDLLAYLALSGDRPVSRDMILDALWPDADPDSAQATLHTTLYYLRKVLQPAGDGLITFAGGAYRLNWQQFQTDLEPFQRLAGAEGTAGAAGTWAQAAQLYRGDLLEGLDYPWCEALRTRMRTLYQRLLRDLSAHLMKARAYADALDWLQRLVQAEPLAEEGHLALMECYAAMGNRNAALQQYRTLVHLLDEELGLEPSPEAERIYRQILN